MNNKNDFLLFGSGISNECFLNIVTPKAPIVENKKIGLPISIDKVEGVSLYYVRQGTGWMEVCDKRFFLQPGTLITQCTTQLFNIIPDKNSLIYLTHVNFNFETFSYFFLCPYYYTKKTIKISSTAVLYAQTQGGEKEHAEEILDNFIKEDRKDVYYELKSLLLLMELLGIFFNALSFKAIE